MKKIALMLFMLILLVGNVCFAADGEAVTVYVNGVKVETDVPAVIVSDTTMIPFRAIFNALGISDENIVWSEKSQHIEARDGNNYIFMAIGSTGAIVNNSLTTLNTAPYIENGRTMVPVRFVSEALGALVEWDGEKGSVYISR